jgi:hypothetical protein
MFKDKETMVEVDEELAAEFISLDKQCRSISGTLATAMRENARMREPIDDAMEQWWDKVIDKYSIKQDVAHPFHAVRLGAGRIGLTFRR